MKFRCVVEYEYPVDHKPPVKAEVVLHGDRVPAEIISGKEQNNADITRLTTETSIAIEP